MEFSNGDLVILEYPNRKYACFVKRVEGDIVVCCEQFAPQYIQEIFIPINSFKIGRARLVKQF